MFVEKHNR